MHHSPHSPAHSIVSTYTGLIYVFSGSKVHSDIAGGPLCQWKNQERRGPKRPRRSLIFPPPISRSGWLELPRPPEGATREFHIPFDRLPAQVRRIHIHSFRRASFSTKSKNSP